MLLKKYLIVGLFSTLFVTNSAQSEPVKIKDNSRQLRDWLIMSLEVHPAVLAARAELDVSSFQFTAADNAVYNPELEIEVENTDVRTSSLGISQTIDWGDTRGARTEKARSQIAVERYSLESTRRNIAVDLLAALSDYHTNVALTQVAEQGNTLMRRLAELTTQRYDTGDLGQVEVDLARLSFAQARFKLADALSNKSRTIHQLIALTGSEDMQWPEFFTNLPDPGIGNGNDNEIISNLPEMRQINSMVAAARANIKVKAGENAANPTLSIRAGKEDDESLVSLSLSVPLQVRNNFKAEVNAANAEMTVAKRRALDSYRGFRSRLYIATTSYELSRNAWRSWEKAGAGSLKGQNKLLDRLWRAGELSTTNYLVQLKQALETKTNAIEQRGKMWSNWTDWLIATGKIENWISTGESK